VVSLYAGSCTFSVHRGCLIAGDTVSVEIVSVDGQSHKMGLTMYMQQVLRSNNGKKIVVFMKVVRICKVVMCGVMQTISGKEDAFSVEAGLQLADKL
jgi:hypothetical protein